MSPVGGTGGWGVEKLTTVAGLSPTDWGVLDQDIKPLTAPNMQVGTLRGGLCHLLVSEGLCSECEVYR